MWTLLGGTAGIVLLPVMQLLGVVWTAMCQLLGPIWQVTPSLLYLMSYVEEPLMHCCMRTCMDSDTKACLRMY